MTNTKTKTTEKQHKSIDKEFVDKINEIVDQFHIQASSRDVVTGLVNELHSTYGKSKPIIRNAAKVIFKRNREELEEHSNEVIELVDRCTS